MPEPELERFWRRLRGPLWFAHPGFRDPDARCEAFNTDGYNGRGGCDSDGHYLCNECSHLSPNAPRFTEYGRDGRRDRLRLFWGRPGVRGGMYKYQHFWEMAHAIRGYCKETGLHVVSRDDKDDRTIGFATDCPQIDARFREWRMSLADVSRTANQRPPSFDSFTPDEMIKMTHPHLQGSSGRVVLAEILSTGKLP